MIIETLFVIMDPTLNNTNFSQENRIMGYFSCNGKLYINESEQSELYGFCRDGENWKDYSSRPYDKQKPKTKKQTKKPHARQSANPQLSLHPLDNWGCRATSLWSLGSRMPPWRDRIWALAYLRQMPLSAILSGKKKSSKSFTNC